MTEPTTFDKILEAVKAGAMMASALAPFLTQGPEYVRQVLGAWKSLGMTDEEIREHIAGSEAEVRALVNDWLANYEPVKHPDSKL